MCSVSLCCLVEEKMWHKSKTGLQALTLSHQPLLYVDVNSKEWMFLFVVDGQASTIYLYDLDKDEGISLIVGFERKWNLVRSKYSFLIDNDDHFLLIVKFDFAMDSLITINIRDLDNITLVSKRNFTKSDTCRWYLNRPVYRTCRHQSSYIIHKEIHVIGTSSRATHRSYHYYIDYKNINCNKIEMVDYKDQYKNKNEAVVKTISQLKSTSEYSPWIQNMLKKREKPSTNDYIWDTIKNKSQENLYNTGSKVWNFNVQLTHFIQDNKLYAAYPSHKMNNFVFYKPFCHSKDYKLVPFGYIRQYERNNGMLVPMVLCNLIFKYYFTFFIDNDETSVNHWRRTKKGGASWQVISVRISVFINNYNYNYNCNVKRESSKGLYYVLFGGMLAHSCESCDHIIQVFDIGRNEYYISNVRSPLKQNGFALFCPQSQRVCLFDKRLTTRFSIELDKLLAHLE